MTVRRRVHASTFLALGSLVLALAAGLSAPAPALAQPQTNPVYVDDSPAARETFLGIDAQLSAGNLDAAVRVLQRLLEEEGDRVVAAGEDTDLFVSVRSRVNALLASSPDLLTRYIAVEGPKAQRALAEGQVERVENVWLLTPAGFEAALRIAQTHLEAARFDAAWLTLRQLENHPERRAQAGADAARLLAEVARYANREDVWAAAERWARQAGAPEPERAAHQWPPAARRVGQTPLDATEQVSLDGLVAKALWTVPVGPAVSPIGREPAMAGGELLPLFARDLRVLPTVAGETVYVNDGSNISAWDRFTLTRRWYVGEPPSPLDADGRAAAQRAINRRFRQNQPDEPSTVAVRGRTVAAVTTAPEDGRREGQMRLSVLDAETGHVRWQQIVTERDEQLDGSSLRATPLIGEGVVVVAARKSNLSRRLTSVYLIGLNEADGRELWRRLVGSAGALPFGGQAQLLDAGILHAGVVYLGDQLGVIGAFEAHSGRPVWVRRIDTQPRTASESARPWEVSTPILDDDGALVILSPDRTEVLRIALSDGEILARRSADRLGAAAPRYLVRVGDHLAVVGESRIGIIPLSGFETAEAASSTRVPEPGIRGRVIGAGSQLLVPLVSGLAIIDAANPASPPVEIALESPGNILALSSQLLVVDDGRMHSYLLWEAAEEVLTERMQADASNPAPAVTFAELAYRGGRPERILPAVQAAIAAIEADPDSESNQAARRRLFASVLDMVNASQEPAGLVAGAHAGEVRLADADLIADLIDQLGRIALDADERASQLLTLGRSCEARADVAGAVRTYQSVLDEPALAAATWSGPQVSLRAELEATWRLQRLLRENGPEIYAPFEAAAQGELAALGPRPDPQRLERVARRYPVAGVTPSIWKQIADHHAAAGRTHAVIPALEAGLQAASWRDDADPALVGELGGRLARALASQGQVSSAAQVLRTLTQRYPGLTIEDTSGPIAAQVLLAEFELDLAARHRWPRIGPAQAQGVQILRDATMLRPRMVSSAGRVGRAIATSNGDEVSVWMAQGEGDDAVGGRAGFVQRWSRPIPGRNVDLLKIEDDSVFLFYDTRAGGVLERVSASRGQTDWQSLPFPDMFPREVPGVRVEEAPQAVQTPRDGMGLLTDLFLAMDERTVTLVERTGRAVGLDARDGTVLWTQRVPVWPVYDTDVRGGTLLVAGDQETPGGAGVESVIIAADTRTGKILQRIESRWGQVRWLRMLDPADGASGSGGSVIVGFENAVVSFDIQRGQANWVLDDRRVGASREAWVIGDRLFLHGAGGAMWVLSTRTGRLIPRPVRLPAPFQDEYQRMFASEIGGASPSGAAVAFSTLAGVVLLNADGEVVGMDAVPDGEAVIPPQAAESMMVTIETAPSGQQSDGQMVFNLHLLDTATGRLLQTQGIVLGARPSRLMLLDDAIAISAGSATLIFPAPASR